MNSKFIVLITSRFEREFKKVAAAHKDLSDRYSQVLGILGADPYNNSRQHPIKKLEAVAEGQGQYRIRSGRFRFRYDIDGQTVYLKACSLRREDTYR
jgi:mRNA-degrading endonuclease RelE of RelBE toxin-antitoxin system